MIVVCVVLSVGMWGGRSRQLTLCYQLLSSRRDIFLLVLLISKWMVLLESSVVSREGSVLSERNRPGLHFWEKEEQENCSGTQPWVVGLFACSQSVSPQYHRQLHAPTPTLSPRSWGGMSSGYTFLCTLWLVSKLGSTNEPIIHNPNHSIDLCIAQNICTISKCKWQPCMPFWCVNTRDFSWISGDNENLFYLTKSGLYS